MMNQEETKEVKNGDKYNIPMLEKSFELLELLIKYPNGLTMQETVNLLNTPKTTVFRLLNSLLNMGYLSKNIDTQQFFLSKKFLKLGLAALGESNIVEQSLSPMPEEELEKALETIQYTVFNKHTIENEAQLKKELERIRKIGYAVDLEEEMAGVQCIAAPIFNQFNNIVATIWTSGPSGRLTKSIFPVVAKELILTANSISTSLGYTCKQ